MAITWQPLVNHVAITWQSRGKHTTHPATISVSPRSQTASLSDFRKPEHEPDEQSRRKGTAARRGWYISTVTWLTRCAGA
eukprot:1248152-Prymnesium_polylepis.1